MALGVMTQKAAPHTAPRALARLCRRVRPEAAVFWPQEAADRLVPGAASLQLVLQMVLPLPGHSCEGSASDRTRTTADRTLTTECPSPHHHELGRYTHELAAATATVSTVAPEERELLEASGTDLPLEVPGGDAKYAGFLLPLSQERDGGAALAVHAHSIGEHFFTSAHMKMMLRRRLYLEELSSDAVLLCARLKAHRISRAGGRAFVTGAARDRAEAHAFHWMPTLNLKHAESDSLWRGMAYWKGIVNRARWVWSESSDWASSFLVGRGDASVSGFLGSTAGVQESVEGGGEGGEGEAQEDSAKGDMYATDLAKRAEEIKRKYEQIKTNPGASSIDRFGAGEAPDDRIEANYVVMLQSKAGKLAHFLLVRRALPDGTLGVSVERAIVDEQLANSMRLSSD